MGIPVFVTTEINVWGHGPFHYWTTGNALGVTAHDSHETQIRGIRFHLLSAAALCALWENKGQIINSQTKNKNSLITNRGSLATALNWMAFIKWTSVVFCDFIYSISTVCVTLLTAFCCATLVFRFNELYLNLSHWDGPRYSEVPEPWGSVPWQSTACRLGTPCLQDPNRWLTRSTTAGLHVNVGRANLN